jgi:hypothetical protein
MMQGKSPSSAGAAPARLETPASEDPDADADLEPALTPPPAEGSLQPRGLTDAEIAGFVRAVGHVAREMGLVETGYRLLANIGIDAHQEVPHLHVHIFGGKPLGPMLIR